MWYMVLVLGMPTLKGLVDYTIHGMPSTCELLTMGEVCTIFTQNSPWKDRLSDCNSEWICSHSCVHWKLSNASNSSGHFHRMSPQHMWYLSTGAEKFLKRLKIVLLCTWSVVQSSWYATNGGNSRWIPGSSSCCEQVNVSFSSSNSFWPCACARSYCI